MRILLMIHQMQKTEVNSRSSLKLYKENTPVKDRLSDRDYLLIAEGYAEFMMEKVKDGEEVTIPAKLGSLRIRGRKKPLKFVNGVPNLPPDWAKTKKLWAENPDAKATKKLIFCTNENTSGAVYKLLWSKNAVPLENKTLYSLRLIRRHKRAIHELVDNGKEYLIKLS